MTSPHLRVVSVLAAVGTCLAVAAVGPADAKKRSCKSMKEQKGCTLKDKASYEFPSFKVRQVKGAPVYARASVSKGRLELVFSLSRDSCSERFDRITIPSVRKPKVGKSYKFKYDVFRRGRARGTADSTFKASGTVKLTSAKSASFTGSYTRTTTDQPSCERSLKVTAKRVKAP